MCDLETIMAPFAQDIVFVSPFVGPLTGDPERAAIRGYCFQTAPSATGADSMRLDASGKVVDWRCHYTFDPSDVEGMVRG